MPQLEFNINKIDEFASWIKRFSLVDKSLLLEVDVSHAELLAKTYNEERSVVKFSKITFDEISFDLKTKKIPEKRIKLGIYDIGKIIKALNQFSENLIFIIKYEEAKYDLGDELAGIMLLFKTDNLKVGFECNSLNIFKYIPDDVFKEKICHFEKLVEFDLKQEDLSKINNLCDLDKEYKKLEFKSSNNKILVKSKSFELFIDINNKSEASLPILKEQFSKIDLENYKVSLGDSKMSFNSIDSQTIVVLGGLDLNEYEKETEMNFD